LSDTRILITTYHNAFLVRGGGEYEIFAIADSLKQSGMIVDIYGPYSRSIDNYDVVLHFSVHGGGIDLLTEIKARGIPIVLWPNLWVRDSSQVSVDLVSRHVDLADIVIFKSSSEQVHFSERFLLPESKIIRVNAGADQIYMKPAPDGLFKSLYGVDKYAIWFGVIEPSKNQLAAIRVLEKKGIPLVLVGHCRDKQYLKLCQDTGVNVLFIKALPKNSEIVRSALQDAMFYIEVSFEPPGLSAIEAGLSGCKLLLSESEWSREHFGDLAVYADPSSDDAISDAVETTIARKIDTTLLVNSLQRFCLPAAIDPLVECMRNITK
jgi:glycosyltransferase involved in cell wall biosynthesis